MEKNKTLRNDLKDRKNNSENVMIKNGEIIDKSKSGHDTMLISRSQTYHSFLVGNSRR